MRARDAVAAAGLRRPILEEGALLWVANLAAVGAGFLVPLALARLSTQADYGRFSFATALLATSSILTLPGLNLAITQGAARGQDGTLRVALRSRLRGALLMAVVVALAGAAIAWYADRTTGFALILASLLAVPAYGLDSASAFFNGRRRFAALSLLIVAAAAVPAVAVAALLLAGAPIPAVLAGYLAALALVNAVSLRSARRLVRNDDVDPAAIRYGRRMTWISSIGAVQFYLDRLVVGSSLGFADLALYSAAKLFQQGLKATWTAVNQLLFPRLAAATDSSSARVMAWRALVPVWVGFVLLGAVTAALAPFIVSYLLGADYLGSVTPARLLILAVLVGIPGAQFEMLFRATSDERRLLIHRTTFAAVEVVATGAGALWYGTVGASAGMVLAYAVNTIVGYVLSRSA